MKRIAAVVISVLFAFQLCLLPVAAQGIPCPSAVTLPATDIGANSAILNGSVTLPLFGSSIRHGVARASLLYTSEVFVQRVWVSFLYGVEPGVYTRETTPIEIRQSSNVQVPVSDLLSCSNQYYQIKVHTIILVDRQFYQYSDSLQGAGLGLDPAQLQNPYSNAACPSDYYGNEVTFHTACPFVNPGGGGNIGAGASTAWTLNSPANMSNNVVQTAAVGSARVSPGEKVDIAASMTNKGGSTGASKVTLYINGQEVESKGITLASGQSETVHFSVSRNEPGTYTVVVNGVPAGSFTVELFTNNDILIYCIIALFTVGIVGLLYLLIRRRTV